MRSLPPKPAPAQAKLFFGAGRPAVTSAPDGGRAPTQVAPFLRRAPGALLGLVNGTRKPAHGRRVRDLAPGETVPASSRLVLRRGTVSER